MSGRPPWYEEGLRFSCRRCGCCCRDHGEPSFVFLHEGDPERLADALGITVDEVLLQYTIDVDGSLCLINDDEDCVFFDPEKKGCQVYNKRPLQCDLWPFWEENLTPWAWKGQVADLCPGVDQGRLYTMREIDDMLSCLRHTKPLFTEI